MRKSDMSHTRPAPLCAALPATSGSAVPLTRLMGVAGLALLAACGNGQKGFDWDMRSGKALDTSGAAQQATAPRPEPDGRGVISYPNYQVAVARRGDTVGTVADRVGLPPAELAQYNALQPQTALRDGEVLALPRRVSEPLAPVATAAAPLDTVTSGPIDVTTLASGAIERAERTTPTPAAAPAPAATPGREPVRHRVARGETAYSIARLYGVSAKSLADWNGLGAEMTVREGQYLMIPVASGSAGTVASASSAAVNAPGTSSPTPTPPSASRPLPEEQVPTQQQVAAAKPSSPNLGSQATSASRARLTMPAEGSIIRPYEKRKNEGIDIAAAAGSTVRAAADGTVAAITQDTDQVPILVVRHANNLLTVYANIDGIKVAKGSAVTRGQPIATVRAGSPAFLHFEVRQGYESVDPMSYLQ